MPTIEAVVERGESPQDRIVGSGGEGEAIDAWTEPLISMMSEQILYQRFRERVYVQARRSRGNGENIDTMAISTNRIIAFKSRHQPLLPTSVLQSTFPKMKLTLQRTITPIRLSGRIYARNVSSRPYTAERSPASKSASTGPQDTTPPTGFAAIASYNVIARRYVPPPLPFVAHPTNIAKVARDHGWHSSRGRD